MPSGGSLLRGMEADVLAQWRTRSRALLYQRDPEAWLWDVLHKRWWSKQSEIGQSFVENVFTLVKSCNGVGKTQIGGDLVSWFVSVFPPEETTVLLSAPVREQIDTMMFKYLKQNYQIALELEHKLVGEITRWPKWIVNEPFAKDIVLPKRPADGNLISSFQGTHDGHVAVILDEAGGLPEDLFIGANAVTTNEHARILAIGNPDKLHTPFHERFENPKFDQDWGPGRITISAEDSPNFTGEMIYPDDLERDAAIKKLLVQVEWAEMMKRSALPGVIKAKVYGEFPDSDDSTFFQDDVIQKAWDVKIDVDDEMPKWIGVDLSYQGEDECALYLNWGGQIRKIDTWNRYMGTEHVESARRINRWATELGATQVRVDAAGTGSGVFSNLVTLEEFKNRQYIVIGIVGSKASPDNNVWAQQRSWHYWQFRNAMIEGRIDLDIQDIDLRDELQRQPYKIDNRGRIQILPKKEMKEQGIDSPDHLDAAIYSFVDVTSYTEGLGAGMTPGEVALVDPWELLQVNGYGLPV